MTAQSIRIFYYAGERPVVKRVFRKMSDEGLFFPADDESPAIMSASTNPCFLGNINDYNIELASEGKDFSTDIEIAIGDMMELVPRDIDVARLGAWVKNMWVKVDGNHYKQGMFFDPFSVEHTRARGTLSFSERHGSTEAHFEPVGGCYPAGILRAWKERYPADPILVLWMPENRVLKRFYM